jgi:hypothetical protein
VVGRSNGDDRYERVGLCNSCGGYIFYYMRQIGLTQLEHFDYGPRFVVGCIGV